MKEFLNEDFLLHSDMSKQLYNQFAKDLPIYDYHCHISPKEIYENISYKNITQLWLYGDHYKWRAMRSNGIDERYITGNATDYEKFIAFAEMLPFCIGNPVYHWCHLELQRYFDIFDELNEQTAPLIWEKTEACLQGKGFCCQDFIVKSNVKVICTTDDPTDNLEYHKLLSEQGLSFKVYPTFRPDKAMEIRRDTFRKYIDDLSACVGYKLDHIDKVTQALSERIAYFHSIGCRLSDHAAEYIPFCETDINAANSIYQKALRGENLSQTEEEAYKTYLFLMLGKEYSNNNWTMQLHIGAMRNNNTKMFHQLGADTGFDSINDLQIAAPLSKFLDHLEKDHSLPKTILYTLNPKDNYTLGTMLGNFQGNIKGKIQFGSAWWFNDQKDGMKAQLKALANLGVLGNFVGMLTDSRSFLSYTRHEYFRRIVCELIGEWVEEGEYPMNMEYLKKIIEGICYYNAVAYFGMEV